MNPLLQPAVLPPFKDIKAEHVEPAINELIERGRRELAEQLSAMTNPSWENLVEPIEARDDELEQMWSPVSHLNGVCNTDELRGAYTAAIAKLTEYSTEVSQNEALYQAYQALADSDNFSSLNTAQKKTVNNALRNFRLAGVALPAEQKKRYGEIKARLSELSNQFSNNVLDATHGWYKHIDDVAELSGLPESAIAMAKHAAQEKELAGYVITLDIPAYLAVMTHADNRDLRYELYRAYVTRSSSEGLSATDTDPSTWDNSQIIEETLALRHELAQLLGFNNYAERSLATKMASSTDEVVNFLREMAETALPAAKKEWQQLADFAREFDGCENLQAWDVAYYSEKQRQALYAISEEELRPYFPAEKVLSGLFAVVQRLFAVDIAADDSVATWHKDARYFRISKNGAAVAGFYIDLFAREKKRGGAWMADCRVRRQTDQGIQLPVAFLTCNFTAPTAERPSLLTHQEVTTLFHEFGHGLHHMLTQIDCAAVSGINGVAWDAVELPSQFLENWCWQEQVIPLISAHYESGEALPKDKLDKLLAAKNYQSAMQTVRQIEFALFDFLLHRDYDPAQPADPQQVLNAVREQVAVNIPPAFNKFQNSFSHIFAGGYAAGYYSYKWAEVLSADAFSLFEENGIFDEATANKFLSEILSRGGSEDAMDLFVRFRGRKPSTEALLRHSGIQ